MSKLLESFSGSIPIRNEKNGKFGRHTSGNVATPAAKGRGAKTVGPSGATVSGGKVVPAVGPAPKLK